MAPVLESC